MARRVRRTPRARRRPYHFRSYAHDLQQAIAEMLKLPGVLTPVRRGGGTPVLTLLAGVLMVFSRATTLTARLDEATAALRSTCRGFAARSYQGWGQCLRKHVGLLNLLAAALRQRTLDLATLRGGAPGRWCLLAVDGSRCNLPRTAACRRYSKPAGKQGTGPQLYLTCLYHVASGLLWDYRLGKGTASERAHLRQMLSDLPPQALLLADAGFVGYPLLAELQRRQIPFLIRAGRNVHVLTDLGVQVQEDQERVYLWPQHFRLTHRRALALRQIVLKRQGRTMALLTNLSCQDLPRATAQNLYNLRWGVEVFYRQLKQKLEKRTLRSTTPAMAVQELHLAVLGLWLAGLLLVRAWPRRRPPLAWARTLELLRQAVACPCRRTWGGWRRVLAPCRADPYVRHGPKRGRYWPDKKRDRPCGLPHVRPATALERRCAQRLTPLLWAA